MEEIREKVTKRSKRNVVSQLIHATNDKGMIAGWKSDLGRILQIFNVRPVIFHSVIVNRFLQIELTMNIQVTISDVNHRVLEIQKEVRGQARSVSTNRIRSAGNRCLQLPRSKSGQQPQLPKNLSSYICI